MLGSPGEAGAQVPFGAGSAAGFIPASRQAADEGAGHDVDKGLGGDRRVGDSEFAPLGVAPQEFLHGQPPALEEGVVKRGRPSVPREELHVGHPQEVGVALQEVGGILGGEQQALPEGGPGGEALQRLQGLNEAPLLVQSLQEGALGVEVVVDGGVADAALAGDVPNGRLVEAALGEETEGDRQDALTGLRAAASPAAAPSPAPDDGFQGGSSSLKKLGLRSLTYGGARCSVNASALDKARLPDYLSRH